VSEANAQARLDSLFELFDLGGHTPATVATAIRDTASAYYGTTTVSQKHRAYAAYLVSNAEGALENRPEALRWARIAADLDPSNRAYQANLTNLSRPPQ
jgi:hypothetical protein